MSEYLLHGKLNSIAGQQQTLADILIQASQLLKTAKGCRLYVVGLDELEPNAVYITEIWESKEDYDDSLKVDGVRELIAKAMPLLDGPPQKGQELEILDGLGI